MAMLSLSVPQPVKMTSSGVAFNRAATFSRASSRYFLTSRPAQWMLEAFPLRLPDELEWWRYDPGKRGAYFRSSFLFPALLSKIHRGKRPRRRKFAGLMEKGYSNCGFRIADFDFKIRTLHSAFHN
jgi:hypothetical protein